MTEHQFVSMIFAGSHGSSVVGGERRGSNEWQKANQGHKKTKHVSSGENLLVPAKELIHTKKKKVG